MPLALIHNVALLLATAVLFDFVSFRTRLEPLWLRQIIAGTLLGIVGVVVMLTPWQLSPGIVFDTRSILISIAALSFGTLPAAVTILITAMLRVWQGGDGTLTGIGVIVSSGVIGILWRRIRNQHIANISASELYLLGVVVHVTMLLLMLTLPHAQGPNVLRNIALPVLILYPLGTVLLGSLMVYRIRRETAVRQIEESREMLDKILNTVPQAIFWKDVNGTYLGCNEVFATKAGFADPAAVIGKNDFDLPLRREEAEAFRADDMRVMQQGVVISHLLEEVHMSNRNVMWADVSKCPLLDSGGRPFGILGIYEDVTEKIENEKVQKTLREKLEHAAKMETVGRLAGGVAHDFNNMLGVILGHIELSMENMPKTDPLYAGLAEIKKATVRSIDLTRQLLAFARRQTASPVALNLNETIEGMLSMLRRLIGENIDLSWVAGNEVGAIMIDPSQLDQILVNLCVNARDAIEGNGRIIIETGKTFLDNEFCAGHLEVEPGLYAFITISDTGCGIPEEIVDHLFEPFFTTKELGKGTGLGLATIYGIVRQNGGLITVDSELSHGSTFKIYLPITNIAVEKEDTATEKGETAKLSGNVLLVEDEPAILGVATIMLENLGLTVFPASSSHDALRQAHDFAGKIDLLITDVIMPDMNGRQLASKIQEHQPDLKVLYMSGYTANVISPHGVLDPGIQFLQKPFTMKDVREKVHAIMQKG